jgi:hypothetical protein
MIAKSAREINHNATVRRWLRRLLRDPAVRREAARLLIPYRARLAAVAAGERRSR